MLFDPFLLLPLNGELWKRHNQVSETSRYCFSRRFLSEFCLILVYIAADSEILFIDAGILDSDIVQQNCLDLWVIIDPRQGKTVSGRLGPQHRRT